MYDYYLFDFDGTIADTQVSILATFHAAFHSLNVDDHEDKDIKATIGIPLDVAFAKLTCTDVKDKLAQDLAAEYRRLYPDIVYKVIVCYPGVMETFQKLKEQGKKIALVSSRRAPMLSDLSHFLKLDPYVDCYVGEDLVTGKKPEPDSALLALKVLGCLDKTKALMVGDTYFDIKMGENAGLDTCYCTYGYGTESSLNECHPTIKIHTFCDILKH